MDDIYAVFLFFHFLNNMEKIEKMLRINIIFLFFYFLGKNGKIEKWSRTRRLFYFSHFSNNNKKIKNSKISFYPFTVFFVFLTRTSKLEKNVKMINFPDHFLFFYFCLCFKICKYDKDIWYFLFPFLLQKWKIRLAEECTDQNTLVTNPL